MWLLKFHLAFSILCLLPVFYIDLFMDKERSKLIDELFSKNKKKSIPKKVLGIIKTMIGCFIPFINILLVLAAFVGGFASEDTLKELARGKRQEPLESEWREMIEEIRKKQKENEDVCSRE